MADFSLQQLLERAAEAQRVADDATALSLYTEAASHSEVPAGDLLVKIGRCQERLGFVDEAFASLASVVDPSDSFMEWSAAAATLARLSRSARPPARRTCRLAVTGSYTLSQFAVMLPLAALRFGIDLTVHEGLYAQYQQDLIDPESGLYASDPDYVVIAVHDGALDFTLVSSSPDDDIQTEAARWHGLWEKIATFSQAGVVQHNFAIRPESEFGNLTGAITGSRSAMIQTLNATLARSAPDHVSLVDCDRIACGYGRERWFDDRYWFRSKQAVALDALPTMARHTAAVIASRLGLQRKCLVLDLDNTLWGGIIGEDGLSGIVLGGDGDGEAFLAFQEYCLALKDRGVILAVASKNNESDAREVFERHPFMRIRLDDIAMFAVNWDDKPTNLRRIAETLGIGLDSLVLVDDSPAERQMVRRLVPEVDVVVLPSQPAKYRRALANYLGFEPTSMTSEDRHRTQQYRARAATAELASTVTDVDSFLRDLRMSAIVAPFDEQHLTRITQLCNKTNQFNLTTRRHSELALRNFMESSRHIALYLKLQDRLVDHGLVAIAIAELKEDIAEIDSFLMSCRVIGRTVEKTLLSQLSLKAEARGVVKLRGTYVPTAKNSIVSDLYERFGFDRIDAGADSTTIWDYDLGLKGPITSEVIAT